MSVIFSCFRIAALFMEVCTNMKFCLSRLGNNMDSDALISSPSDSFKEEKKKIEICNGLAAGQPKNFMRGGKYNKKVTYLFTRATTRLSRFQRHFSHIIQRDLLHFASTFDFTTDREHTC